MEKKNLYQANDGTPTDNSLHLQYRKALLSRRIFAKIIDFLLLILIGAGIFLGVRAIVNSTPMYTSKVDYINHIQLDSSVYVSTKSGNVDIVTYYDSYSDDFASSQKMNNYAQVIDKFIEFVGTENGTDSKKIVQDDYDSFRLNLSYNDTKLFVWKDDAIIRNPDFSTSDTYLTYVEQCYEPYIDNHVRSMLLTLFPKYLECTKFMSTIILVLELPVAVVIGSLLVFLVPPLIFRRNRQTIGMLVYHIGKANTDLLSIPTGKYLGYCAIWILGVICLSFVTLGAPLFVSASMMVFTKTKQDFPEYMLQLYDLDLSNDKIYFSLAEIAQDHSYKQEISDKFKMDKPR